MGSVTGHAMRSIDQLLTALHKIAERFSAEERPIFHAGASPDALAALQAAVGAQLPDDFAAFLSTTALDSQRP
jgi:hypothetical protein